MNTLSIEPYGLRSPLANWSEQAARTRIEEVHVLPPKQTPMRLLSPVELATLRAVVTAAEDCPRPSSILGECSVRLAIFQQRGLLQYFSGDYLARNLEWVWHPRCRNARRPLRGYELIRHIDLHSEITGVEFWLSAEPTEEEPTHHRRIRLRERIAELTCAS